MNESLVAALEQQRRVAALERAAEGGEGGETVELSEAVFASLALGEVPPDCFVKVGTTHFVPLLPLFGEHGISWLPPRPGEGSSEAIGATGEVERAEGRGPDPESVTIESVWRLFSDGLGTRQQRTLLSQLLQRFGHLLLSGEFGEDGGEESAAALATMLSGSVLRSLSEAQMEALLLSFAAQLPDDERFARKVRGSGCDECMASAWHAHGKRIAHVAHVDIPCSPHPCRT